ncbi:type VI secretion system ATPase TssH [Pendulispora rubella]|uniref:Type VI secretion system ATPase TssH n=2 Tax=Pendulispora rubella TaxID=2741070 RepID=A0ABZ2KYC3_9BACT
MLIAEPRALLEKLNSVSRRALEAAAGASVTGRHYEVTVEHFLHALLDVRESDLVVLLDRFQIDPSRTRARLHKSLTELRTGNAGRPGFSPLLLELLQDAWIYATTELHATRLRSGAVLVRLLHAPGRYLPLDVTLFEGLPTDDLRKNLLILAGESAEAIEDAAAEWSGGGGARPSGGAPAPGAGGDTALARFTTNLTERAKKGGIDPVFGREGEVRQVVDILCRRRKNNPIIVGEPGVGKTALVEGLAVRIAEGDVPEFLKDTQVVVLDLGSLQAGAGVKGEFENRLKSVISEVKASPKPIVLFIDEAHTLIGAGGAQGAGDAANLLKPALARGELRTIAATTWAEYKRYFEKDAALERRFQPVKVDEPGIEAAVLMLRGLAQRFEEAHGVVIRDEAVRAAVTLSSRYIAGRQLPDKAVDLLDTSAARVRVLRGAPPAALEDARAELAAVEREIGAFGRDHAAGVVVDEEGRKAAESKRDELRERVATLEARLAEQRALVQRVDELRRDVAKIGNPGAGAAEQEKGKGEAKPSTPSTQTAPETAVEHAAKLEDLRIALGRLRAIPREELVVFADVDETLVATIVADWTGIPVGRMVQDDVAAILSLEDRLRQRVRGQDPALSVIARELRSARSGLKAPGAPLGVFLLVGPSGVGKTETALALADLLFGGERFVVTINMSEFQEKHTVSRLIGSPPGYVGFGEGGMLTEAVRQRPYSVVLLDEVEKADREVMNLFYQVFDKGMLADGEGRVIDFANTVVIMTSNLATDLITHAADPAAGEVPSHDDLISLVKPTLSAHFKPALLARMTVVPYIPIRSEALLGITRMKLGAVAARTREAHGLELEIDDAVIDAVAARCREVESGARNVDHILRGTILPLVSNALLEGIASGKATRKLRLTTDDALSGSAGFVCISEEK